VKFRKDMEENKKNQSPKRKIIILVILLTAAYFFFLNDFLAYQVVKSDSTIDACEDYLSDYSDGYFAEDVSFIYTELSRDIVIAREFMEEYPESEYYHAVEDIKHELWDAEIAYYDSELQHQEFDPEASVFFRNLLHYMKNENIETIGVKLVGDVKVKDFNKYEPEIVQLIDAFYLTDDGRNVSENITEIEKHYEKGNILTYEDIICNSIEASFESILSENFITVESQSNEHHKLVINIDYQIENEEDEDGFPSIWVHSSSQPIDGGGPNDYDKIFRAYIIGVAIEFDFSMEIPNDSEQNYAFHFITKALDNIDNIDNIEEGYSEMTKQNFYNFAKAISTKFGISKMVTLCECKELFNDFTVQIEAGSSDVETINKEYYFEIKECQELFKDIPDEEQYAAVSDCP
jgi:YHS domain-containing protein